MASTLVANPYSAQQYPSNINYIYSSAPQPPPSPPMDDNSKCSLPSISNLLGLADGGSPKEQHFPQQSPQQAQAQAQQQQSMAVQDYRQSQPTQQYATAPASVNRGALPPTPPIQPDGFDGRQSPSAASAASNSQYSVVSAPSYYFAPAAPSVNMESHVQRQQMPVMTPQQRRVSYPSYAQQSPMAGAQYGASPQQPMTSYYSPGPPPQQQISGLYYQRPLPQTFPPPLLPVQVSYAPSSGANPWQHHHYISPSSQATFPQSQDRYICPTCNKAFSRPSSLRIHSHSHTGEKPFKCPHQGCGKAFSVRSNMKRHERGCHTFESSRSL